MKLKEKEFFNSISSKFDTQFNVYSKPIGKLRIKKRIDFFSNYCDFNSDKKVLEIGCGTGEYTRELVNFDCKVFCVDVSFEMLKIAKNKICKFSNVYFVVADVEYLPFKDKAFDVVLGNAILHHLELRKSLFQIKRALKENGKFSFSEPNMLNPHVFLQKKIPFLRKLAGDSPTETAFFSWELKTVLKQSGFKNIVIESRDFLYPFVPNAFINFFVILDKIFERTLLIKEIGGSLFIKGAK